MRSFRRIKRAVSAGKTRGFCEDGIIYRTKQMAALHRELKRKLDEGIIESFRLPSIDEEEKAGKSKLGSKKCFIDGFRFDSLMEGKYYVHLLEEQHSGKVTGFVRQKVFELQPSYVSKTTGKKISAIKYIADFVIGYRDGRKIVADIKGMETMDFKIKKKMFGYKYPDTEFICIRQDKKSGEWVTAEEKKRHAGNRKR